ncbi:hypothetical protein [Vulgatibacter sp.]|uniref:hypothetical protein n=1 Tax=Vulgatibacter sp. TaxID=1971226 RepID=UPI003563C6BA
MNPYDMTPPQFAAHLREMVEVGAQLGNECADWIIEPAFLETLTAAEDLAALTGFEPDAEVAAAVARLADALSRLPAAPDSIVAAMGDRRAA